MQTLFPLDKMKEFAGFTVIRICELSAHPDATPIAVFEEKLMNTATNSHYIDSNTITTTQIGPNTVEQYILLGLPREFALSRLKTEIDAKNTELKSKDAVLVECAELAKNLKKELDDMKVSKLKWETLANSRSADKDKLGKELIDCRDKLGRISAHLGKRSMDTILSRKD